MIRILGGGGRHIHTCGHQEHCGSGEGEGVLCFRDITGVKEWGVSVENAKFEFRDQS